MTASLSDRAAGRPRSRVWLHRLALLLCAATVVLLAAGALVVGTGSSLAVPDWPLAYGQVFPPMVGGILYEHGHRLIAASVGLLTLILALGLWAAEPRGWVKALGFAALGAVVAQGLLGGLTVLLLLPKSISISHALLAQGFFVLTVLLAQVTAADWPEPLPAVEQGRSRHLGLATLIALEGELLLGALVRHYNAGLAIPDFPLAFGQVWPPLGDFLVTLQFLHRLGALAVVLLALWSAGQVWREHRDGRARLLAVAILILLALQVALGAGIVWTARSLIVTTAHVVNAALLAGGAALLTLRAWQIEAPAPARARAVP